MYVCVYVVVVVVVDRGGGNRVLQPTLHHVPTLVYTALKKSTIDYKPTYYTWGVVIFNSHSHLPVAIN